MAERLIGEAYISILANTAGFGPDARAKVNKALMGIRPKIDLGVEANTKFAQDQVDALTARILATRPVIDINANTREAASKLATLQLNVLALRNSADSLQVDMLDDKALAKLAALKALIDRLEKTSLKTDITDSGSMYALEAKVRSALISYEALARGADEAGKAIGNSGEGVQRAAESMGRLGEAASRAGKELEPPNYKADVFGRTIEQLQKAMDRLDLDPDKDAVAYQKFLNLSAALELLAKNADNLKGDSAIASWEKQAYSAATGVDDLVASVKALNGESRSVNSQLAKLRELLGTSRQSIDINDTGLMAKLSALDAATLKLKKDFGSIGDDAGLAKWRAALDRATASAASLVKEATEVTDATNRSSDETDRSAGSWVRLSGIVNNLSSIHIPLFAAALHEGTAAGESLAGSLGGNLMRALLQIQPPFMRTASGAHMLVEAGIEIAAVWVPAAIALTAFGAAAAPIVMKVAGQVKNMYTVVQATGQQFKYLGTTAGNLEKQIKPSVYTALGTALEGLQGKSGNLGSSLQVVGRTVDSLVTQFVVWTRSSNSTGQFMKTGAADAHKLFEAFAALGGIIHTLLASTPGIAENLLSIGTAFLQGADAALKFAQPLVKIFLAFHGYEFYIGGLATALAILASKFTIVKNAFIATGAISASETAIKDAGEASAASGGKFQYLGTALGNLSKWGKDTWTMMAAGSGSFEKLGAALGVATTAEGGFTKTGSGLIGLFNPWLLGIAAVGTATFFLVKYLREQKSAEDLIYASTEKAIGQANSFAAAQSATASGMSQLGSVLHVLTGATGGFITTSSKAPGILGTIETSFKTLAHVGQNVSQTYKGTTSSFVALANQSATQAVRWNAVSKAAGGASAAQTLVQESGIKVGDLLGSNAKKAQAAAMQLQGTAEAYGIMGGQAGAAGQHLNALNLSQGQAVTSAQKLTAAETQFVSSITAGDTNLQAFVSGVRTLSDSLNKGSAAGVKYTTAAGKLTEKHVLAAHAMNGTSTAALANRQAFASNVNAAETLYTSLQNMAAEAGNGSKAMNSLSTAGKSMVAQLLPMARTSKSAQAEVYALAQTAGYTGTRSFASMSKWAGSATGATSRLNAASTTLMETASSLSKDVQNTYQALQAYSNTALINAITQTLHLNSSIKGLTSAFISNGRVIDNNVLAQTENLYQKYIQAGMGAGKAKAQVDRMLASLGASPAQIDKVNSRLYSFNASTQDAANVNAKLAAKLRTSQSEFEKFAEKAGLSKTAADKLYTSIHNLPTAKQIKITEEISGGGKVTIQGSVATNQSTGISTSLKTGEQTFNGYSYARGGIVPGTSSSVTKDTHLAAVKSGELIIPSQHAAKYGAMAKRDGIPGFAAGGVVGSALDSVNSNLVPVSQKMANSVAQGATQAFVDKAIKAMNQAYESNVKYKVGAGVNQWRGDVMKALQLLHLPASLASRVLYQMQTESGGNPNAVNLTDSNARAGHPSRGLMQTIPSTFIAYHVPGTSSNINDPLANIAAAINYAEHAYGPSLGALGSGHGYSAGGTIPEKVLGFGVTSGTPYSFGSGEQVTPAGQVNSQNGSGEDTAQVLMAILNELQKGNMQAAKATAQLPYSLAAANRNPGTRPSYNFGR